MTDESVSLLDNMTLADRLRPVALAYQQEMTALIQERENLNARIKQRRDRAKEDGLPHIKLADARIKLQVKLTPQEQADLARTDAMYADFYRMPIGAQADAFGDARIPDAHQNVLGWEARGRQDGLAGRGGPDLLPPGLPEEARKPYGDAWEAGQKETQEAYLEIERRRSAAMAPPVPKASRKKKDAPQLSLVPDPDSAEIDAEADRLRNSSFMDQVREVVGGESPDEVQDDVDEPPVAFGG